MGIKASDLEAADMCSNCHDLYDRRVILIGYFKDRLNRIFENAVNRTHKVRGNMGFQIIKDGVIE